MLANDQGKDQGGDCKRGDALERALDADDLDSLEARQHIIQTAVGPSGDPEELLKRIHARFDRCVLTHTCMHVMLALRLPHTPSLGVSRVRLRCARVQRGEHVCSRCRVGLELPTVEVRFEGVQVETEVFRETSRNLPSLYNTLRNSVEVRVLVVGFRVLGQLKPAALYNMLRNSVEVRMLVLARRRSSLGLHRSF